MKKKLSTVVLVATLFSATNAYAIDEVFDTIAEIQAGLTAASTAIIEAKTTLMQEFNELSWIQQAKDMIQTIKDINHAREELTSEVTGLTSLVTDMKSKILADELADPNSKVDYRYAEMLPDTYIGDPTCATEMTPCTMSGSAYKGTVLKHSSYDTRNALRVDPSTVGYTNILGITVGKSISQYAREAEERNVQDVAVINEMAREAFVQSTNRIKWLDYLKDGLEHPPSGTDAATGAPLNSLKYTTDIQAKIQAEEALLVNDQNKLAALAVLQQSQHDLYEVRKNEISAYVKSGDRNASALQATARAGIALATTGAYTALNAIY